MLYQPILYTTKLTRQFEKAKSFLNKNPQIPLREQHIQHQVHGGGRISSLSKDVSIAGEYPLTKATLKSVATAIPWPKQRLEGKSRILAESGIEYRLAVPVPVSRHGKETQNLVERC